MMDKIYEIKLWLDSLTIFRGLLQNEVIGKLYKVLQSVAGEESELSGFVKNYCELCKFLIEHNSLDSLSRSIAESIVFDDNIYARLCENEEYDRIGSLIIEAVEHDLGCLQKLASISSKDLKEAVLQKQKTHGYMNDIIDALPEWNSSTSAYGKYKTEYGTVHEATHGNKHDETMHDALYRIVHDFTSSNNWKDCTSLLHSFYRENGSGDFARFKSFIWEREGLNGTLKGVNVNDSVRFSDLIGYELERKEIIENTLQLLNGYPANNILLYGDRGTGKSSTVKALMNEYSRQGLRIIELPKAYLRDFSKILRVLNGRKQKFIIFIDDLAFEDNEENYTALKAILEGGLEIKPRNVVIYATSNRRHLIKEKFSERSGLASGNHDDEVRAQDTIQEKLSLADRFGITVTFSSPDKAGYLEIVEGIAKNRGLAIDRDTLHREALKWEFYYNGRSPRTARQFVDWLEGKQSGLTILL